MCHAIRGTPAISRAGPDLTHAGSRLQIAAATLLLTRGSLAAWIADPHGIKPGVHMPAVPLEPDQLSLFLGGLLSMAIRLQLSTPENDLIGPDLYNQIFTMHGSTMMFLFAVPAMGTIAVYLAPLMVGTRNIAFPRLNALSYWIYLFGGGTFLWLSFLVQVGPDVGWFAYVPLSNLEYSPIKRADVWAQMITFTELSAILMAISVIVTVFKQRAPGMSLDRIPVLVWAMVVVSFLVLFAMPAIMVASTSLILDRLVSTQFFIPDNGGNALLWQHLFWFFGHPEVYIIFLPGAGMVSMIVESFSRRPVFGYKGVVLSLFAIGFLSFGLWVHHMFVTGLPQLGASFFTATSMLIAIPAGIQIFCWITTMATGRVILRTPMRSYWASSSSSYSAA